MTDPALRDEDRDAYLERMTDLIKEYGHALQGVFGDGGTNDTFTYTVGLSGMDHPELIIIGLPYQVAGVLLNDMADRVHQGQRFAAGQIIDDLVHNFPVVLIEVSDTTERLTVSNALYAIREPITALQIVYPDAESRWPWQEGSGVAKTDLLGPVPDGLR